jgi:hypothetical protein
MINPYDVDGPFALVEAVDHTVSAAAGRAIAVWFVVKGSPTR